MGKASTVRARFEPDLKGSTEQNFHLLELTNNRSGKFFRALIIGLLLPVLLPGSGQCRPIEMPITIDYAFLRALVISAAFPEPENTALLVDKAEGCRRVAVSEPQFSQEGAFVRLETNVSIRMGALLGQKCRFKIQWDGFVSLVLEPRIDPELWRLGFRVVDSKVYDAKHKPARIVGLIWKTIQGEVFEYLGGITVDLAPPVQELKALLPEVFARQTEEKVRRFVDEMHPGPVRVAQEAISIPILSELEEIPLIETAIPEVLIEEELARLTRKWEDLDIFLVYLVTSLQGAPLSADERDILFTALLEARYGFVNERVSGTLTDRFIQDQFISAWTAISPVFRSQLERKHSGNPIGYLSFFTASDALKSLQAIGPSLGLDLSRDGLIRLAGFLADGRAFEWGYGDEIDADLRKTFDLGEAPEIPNEPAAEGLPEEVPNTTRLERFIKRIFSATVSRCWAADAKPSAEALRQWLVSRENVETYIPAVQKILEEAAQKAFQGVDFEEHQRLARTAVMATAWQESCWRQFYVRKGRLTYIRSYNGTSVGLMQINERVWRGLYKLDALRWNIRYNALAGCDIMNLYLTKYILKKKDQLPQDGQLDPDLVSRLLYAMYNGGPGEFRSFLARHANEKYYRSDDLFWEKYQWAEAQSWDKGKLCLFGEE